ncbi:MAG TPA: hypothetical protein VN035_06325 [Microbacterium sp.]|nr:hypothetical protein [Microbacterium sp.]
MTDRTPEAPIGHVVHLVRTLDDPTVPERIRFPTRMRLTGQIVVWLLVVVAAVGTGILLFHLWTGDSPWWFDLIFTFMPGFVVVGFAAAFADSTRRSRTEAALARRWAEMRGTAGPGDGRIVDRQVSLTEHGGVSAFTLTVTTSDGAVIRARWFRDTPDAADVTLLQTQVPAVGSRVRIWRIGTLAEDAPVIVEALDPSIVS